MSTAQWPDPVLRRPGEKRRPRISEPVTKEKWKTYLNYVPPPRPEPLTEKQYSGLTTCEQEVYDRARRAFHSSLNLLDTEPVVTTRNQIAEVMTLNQYCQPSASIGVMLSGPSRTGKTTAAKTAARHYELALRARDPESFMRSGDEYLPVAFIQTPFAKVEVAKALLHRIATFYGIPTPSNPSPVKLLESVVQTMDRCETQLVIFDDLHFLDLTQKSGRDVNNILKSLANEVPATFVVTGVDLVDSMVFTEGLGTSRATQTRGRYTLVPVDNYSVGTDAEKKKWVALITSFEQRLVLLRHENGTLAGEWNYIHQRTHGSINALYMFVRRAALSAQASGRERITRCDLDNTPLDIDSDARFAEMQAQAKPPRKR